MMRHVRVSFPSGEAFEFAPGTDALAAFDADEARAWLAAEFSARECVPSNPMGKVLLADMIVAVARAAGPAGFAAAGDWPQRYACAVARLRSGDCVHVDVAACSVL